MSKYIYWPGGLFHHWWKAPLSNASFMRIVFCKLRIWIVLVLQWAWLWLIHMTDPSRATAHCSVLIKYCKSVSKGSQITQRDALQTTHQVYSCNGPRNGCKVLISQCFSFSLHLWSSQFYGSILHNSMFWGVFLGLQPSCAAARLCFPVEWFQRILLTTVANTQPERAVQYGMDTIAIANLRKASRPTIFDWFVQY